MVSSRTRFVVTISFAAVLGVALFLFGLLALIGGFTQTSGVDWNGVVGSVFFIGGGVLCGIWVMHLEHRLRGHPAGKIALAGARLHRSTPASSRTPRGRRNSPVAAAVLSAFFALATVLTIVAAFRLHAEADLSGYVQAHGLPRGAAVTSVRNIQHHSKSSTWYTAQVTATVSAPVTEQAVTTVYVPGSVSFVPGQTIAVLVDPGKPSYAELPGWRYVDSSQWIIATVVAVLLLAFDVLIIRVTIRTIRQRHAWRAMLPSTHQPASS
jgi:hypothetical protein